MHHKEYQPHSANLPHTAATSHVPVWAGFHATTIVSLGTPKKPVERLIGLQSGVYRLIVVLGNLPSLLRVQPSRFLGATFSRGTRAALDPK
ncbi:MAG: hypothetical protein R3245_03850 [Kiloniellales bacterium]|nr:hypothetical protein [Kiloniellales bacterium]